MYHGVLVQNTLVFPADVLAHVDGECMAARKYVSDYRLEKHILPNGKVESVPVYQGAYFTFVHPAEIRRLHKCLLATCLAVFALLVPMFLDNTRLGRTIYVILPAAAVLVPLYLLLASARRLGFTEDPFTREHRDKTDNRIRGASVALTVTLAATCAGTVLHFILNGIASDEIFCAACLMLALAASIPLLRMRKLARTKETGK